MPMGAGRLGDMVTRLNREDHKRTKHDSHFSKWKILIGPHDWEDHSVGKEGVARYRVENLPKCSSSGLYELAIYRTGSSTRNHLGKLDPDKVLVVYLGEADNVRTRLQQYGRTGSHLGRNGYGDKVCGCFEDIFARGYSIAYRWGPMENKADARRTEAQLLNTFDYAWNKGSNGVRRHGDILQKLDKHASNLTKLANFTRKHLSFLQKQVGIKIKASKLLSDGNEFSKHADGESRNFLRQVFKFSRSQPRLVSDQGGSNKNDTITCGVVLEDGSICKRPPAEGRKRCAEHKGRKTKGSSTRSSTSHKSVLHKGDYSEIAHCGPICGAAVFGDYSETTRYQAVPYAVFDSYSDEDSVFDNKSHVFDTDSRFDSSNQNNCSNSSSSRSIGGAPTCNGAPCKRTVKGNGRCWQHLNYSGSSSSRSTPTQQNSNYSDSDTSICGAPTHNGSFCQITVKGNGRCWQH